MEQQLTKKYGLPTAICMVVGIVIGSGIFFKAEKILNATGGDLRTGILAWIIGGLIAISNACAFAVMATRYQKVGGMVDYAEAAVGRAYGYYLGWFLAAVYYPCLTSTLAWVSARYTCVLLGYDIVSGECMTITLFYLVAAYFINTMAPRLAGKLQVSMTLIKLVPILLMAGMGTAAGLRSGMTAANFAQVTADTVTAYPLFTALAATAFAYEGWVVATTINAELKDPKRTLPLALVCGVGIIMLIYLFYYVGIAGAVPNAVMMESGEHGARLAFSTIFGQAGGTILFVFVLISCLGTCNGLMMGCTRGFYALAARGTGPKPQVLSQVDPSTGMTSSPRAWMLSMPLGAFSTSIRSYLSVILARFLLVRVPIFPPAPITATRILLMITSSCQNLCDPTRSVPKSGRMVYLPRVSFTLAAIASGEKP